MNYQMNEQSFCLRLLHTLRGWAHQSKVFYSRETPQTNGYECQTRVVHDGITVETHREQRASETVGGTDFADSSESYLHL